MSEERTLILKLGQMITDRIGHKVTVDDPEYWGLAEVLTDEMAEVCLAMKVRKPMTLEQIAKKSGKDKARVQQLLDEMSVIGMIEYNWENADRHKQYVLPMFVPGCAEFMMMNKKQTEEHPVIAEFFENMSRLPLEKVTPMVPPGGSGIGMHVIPVEKAIPAQQQSASVEHISHWLRKYGAHFPLAQEISGQIRGGRLLLPPPAADARRGMRRDRRGSVHRRRGYGGLSCGDRERPLYRSG